MSRKLQSILLVDDNEFDNFFHQRVIQKNDLADEILIKQGAVEALEYLKSVNNANLPLPELIFLDVNMPKMNGWEFIEEYKKIKNKQKESVIIVMLTTSDNPNDLVKASSFGEVAEYRNKPLTKEMVDEIISKHFENKN